MYSASVVGRIKSASGRWDVEVVGMKGSFLTLHVHLEAACEPRVTLYAYTSGRQSNCKPLEVAKTGHQFD
jgi:hypothetical protein